MNGQLQRAIIAIVIGGILLTVATLVIYRVIDHSREINNIKHKIHLEDIQTDAVSPSPEP